MDFSGEVHIIPGNNDRLWTPFKHLLRYLDNAALCNFLLPTIAPALLTRNTPLLIPRENHIDVLIVFIGSSHCFCSVFVGDGWRYPLASCLHAFLGGCHHRFTLWQGGISGWGVDDSGKNAVHLLVGHGSWGSFVRVLLIDCGLLLLFHLV